MQVGILLNNIGNNQAAFYALNNANTIHKLKLGHLIEIYYQHVTQPVIRPMCLVNTIDKATLVKDVVIATDLCTCKYLNAMTAKHKFFYLFDLEWLRYKVDYIDCFKMLQDVNIICGSKEHAEVIKKYCGKEAKVIESFNVKRILDECVR